MGGGEAEDATLTDEGWGGKWTRGTDGGERKTGEICWEKGERGE